MRMCIMLIITSLGRREDKIDLTNEAREFFFFLVSRFTNEFHIFYCLIIAAFSQSALYLKVGVLRWLYV